VLFLTVKQMDGKYGLSNQGLTLSCQQATDTCSSAALAIWKEPLERLFTLLSQNTPMENTTQHTNTLEELLALCESLHQKEERKAEIASELALLQVGIDQLAKRLIPDLMQAVNLTEIRLTDGRKVCIKPDILANVSKDRMPEVLNWLREHNAQAIAKRKLVVDINDMSQEAAASIQRLAEELGSAGMVEASIHPSTLRAFVKEQIEQETPDFPRVLFGVYEGSKAVITAAM
jgi:uncharacterized protein YicC (UPF0701 family)